MAENEQGETTPAWIGLPRSDVATAFPDRAHADSAGFLARVAGDPHTTPSPAAGRWWCQDEASQWWVAPAHWPAREPVELTPVRQAAEPPAAVAAAARQGEDPEARFRLALAASTGVTLRLDIINKCNLRCVMCHYQQEAVFRRPTRQVTLEEFEAMFAAVGPLLSEIVLSCADEPLISRFFSDIVRLIRQRQPDIEIKFCTNAVLLTAPIRRLLIEQQVDLIVVSMDGATRTMFESIRTGARYDQVVGNILALHELRRRVDSGRPAMVANFVMMQRNLHETIPFVSLARQLGANTIDFRHVVASHDEFDLHNEQLQQTPGRYNYYRSRLIQLGHEHGMAVYLPPAYDGADEWSPGRSEPVADLTDFEHVAASLQPDSLEPPLNIVHHSSTTPGWIKLNEFYADTFCPRPFSEIMIREQDEILPCPWHGRSLGRLGETPQLIDTFLGEQFQMLRQNMLRSEGDPHCADCPLKSKELPDERFT